MNPAPPGDSDAILTRLLRLHPKAIDLSLGRMTRLLAKLGNPERAMPPVIHIAGTNGKGSVLAYMEAILRAAGYRTLSYVSPHLVRFAERLRIDGVPIEEAALAESLAHCETVNGGEPITFFEVTTAAAFHAFRAKPADALLLEVGLGGRLDATNVVERPALTVITPVSIDHTQYLGDSLAGIAAEKAGILKPGVPAAIGRQEAEAADTIARIAQARGAPLTRFGREWSFTAVDQGFRLEDPEGADIYPLPGLAGPHQCENAALAAVCARQLRGFDIGHDAVAAGLRRARWPGRLHRVGWPGLAAGWELWVDGGHNAAAGAALGRAVREWVDRPLDLAVGMLNTKPPAEFLAPLAPYVRRLAALAVPGEAASAPADAIRDAALALGIPCETASGVDEAVARFTAGGAAPGRILVCGSLYLVGNVLAAAGEPAA